MGLTPWARIYRASGAVMLVRNAGYGRVPALRSHASVELACAGEPGFGGDENYLRQDKLTAEIAGQVLRVSTQGDHGQ